MNPNRRRTLQLLGAAGFVALAGKVTWLQAVEGAALAAKAKAERTVSWVNRAPRGDILGRDGTVLASSAVSYDIGVNQIQVSQYERTEERTDPATGEVEEAVVGHGAAAAAELMAPILGLDPQELGAAMVGDSTYAVIAEAVPPDTWRQIKALSIPGVEPDQRTRRTYPAGSVAGNVLGFTYEGEERVLLGTAGIELTQNDALTGVDGEGSVEIGRSGVIIPTGEQGEVLAVPGASVRLTIDPDLQVIAQEAIDQAVADQGADWGSVVVVEPATGKVLVMADSRSLNPADPTATAEADRGARSVEAIFEPGSVGKVITFAAALEEGTVTPEDVWTVPYSWTAPNGQSFRDAHGHPTLSLTTSQVLIESSNVGTVQVGDTVSDELRHEYMARFGLGRTTGIEMPGESAGLFFPAAEWDDRTRYTTMFGQGVAGTTLQAVQVLAAVANKGVLVPPRVVDAWIGDLGEARDAEDPTAAPTPAASGTGGAEARATVMPQTQPEGVRVISEATASTLTEMLIGVTQEGGTAQEASIDGYLVAGKTGTTELLSEDGTVASFVGFTPAHDPAIAVAVIVYRPRDTYGGVVSAPVFRSVALAAMRSMGIAPDPTVIAAQTAGSEGTDQDAAGQTQD